MLALSLFFAKLLGIYLLIISLIGFLRKQHILHTAREMINSPALMLFAGAMNLLLGLTIVIPHSIWEWNWRGLITLLGYLAILKGMIRLTFPELDRMAFHFIRKWYWWVFSVLFLIGLYLTVEGFTG